MDQTEIVKFLASHQWIIIAAILWTLPWKGVALWKAAKKGDLFWFILIFIINTLAILEIIFIFFVSRKKAEVPDGSDEKSKVEKKIV